jgi:septal ring factor EnvC (AmiA/AmiB activator)
MDLKSLSKESTESQSYYPNITMSEANSKSEFSSNPKISGNYFYPKDSFKISHEPSLPELSSLDWEMRALEEILNDVSLMKKTCCHIISQINKKDKEKFKKKTILKDITSTCKRNKKKIRKAKCKLQNHEDRIIAIERTLNTLDFRFSSSKSPKFQKNFLEKGATAVPRVSPSSPLVNLSLTSKKSIKSSPSHPQMRHHNNLI